MSVHMVRVLCEPPKTEAKTAVSNWVSNYAEWTNDPVTHSLSVMNTAMDGTGTEYVQGDWRFHQDGETPTGILTDLSGRLQSINGSLWHRLGYHVCTHDEVTHIECRWGETLDYGSVPEGVSL